MAVSVGRKILLDTNVFIDYLRLGSHADSVSGRAHRAIRFLSSVVLMELRLAVVRSIGSRAPFRPNV